MLKNYRGFVALLFSLSTLVTSVGADENQSGPMVGKNPGESRKGWAYSELGKLPMQAGGRIKPLDSYARDTILLVTGRREFQGWDPVELMISWLAFPQQWATKEFILINRKDVKTQLGLDPDRSRFSPQEVLSESFLAQYAQELEGARTGLSVQATPIGKTAKQDARTEELKRVIERISVHRAVVTGDAWPVIPNADAAKPWANLAFAGNHGGEGSPSDSSVGANGVAIREGFLRLFSRYLQEDRDGFAEASATLLKDVQTQVPAWDASAERKVSLEVFYNRFDPFQWAWILYLVAAILWVSLRLTEKDQEGRLPKVALGLTLGGFILHVGGMAIRSYIAGRPPVTNMYESIIWVAFGVMLFSFILWKLQRNTILFAVSCAIATVCLIISDAAPGIIDPGIHPLVPVLRSNYWLTIHVLTITISYAAFALSMGLSNVSLFHYLKQDDCTEDGKKKIATFNQLAYRAMQFGVVLLAAGTILGGVWADYSWGRFWGWDPKEVWALIALLGYILVLHARLAGWLRPFGFAAWTVLAYTLVVMAWYGVNFVLGVGLHSYGFSTGGQGFVGMYVLLQTVFVIAATYRHRQVLARESN